MFSSDYTNGVWRCKSSAGAVEAACVQGDGRVDGSFRRSDVTPKRFGFADVVGGSSCCMRRFENDSTLEMQRNHCCDDGRPWPVGLACVVAAPRLGME